MAIEQPDAASYVSGGAERSTITWQHTVSGADRLLLVGIAVAGNPLGTETVTFNGDSLTQVDTTRHLGNEFSGVALFSLVAPDVGTFDIVATGVGSYSSIAGGAISLTGVHQTTPLGTPNSVEVTTQALEISVTSATGEVVVDVAATSYAVTVIAADASQAQQWETYFANSLDGNQLRRRVGMSKKAGAASITMAWTGQFTDGSAIIAVPVKPAAASSVTWLRHRA